MAEHLHDGHRGRMRDRFMKNGLEGYQPHEVLEMLLFYAIPRRNTNPLSHRLLEQCGSLHGVISANPDMLKQVPEMTEPAVVFLTFIRALLDYDLNEQFVGKPMDTFDAVRTYFVSCFRFERNEVVRAALLDDRLRLVQCVKVSEGHPSAAEISVRKLTELSLHTGCNVLILAHNHPKGTAEPSEADIAVTRSLAQALQLSGIRLVDHIVVGENNAVSLRECGGFLGI